MHEGPELHEIVLQGRARDEQAALRVEVEQRLPPLALPVLDHVRLIQDEILPLLPLEHLCVLHFPLSFLGLVLQLMSTMQACSWDQN